MGKILDIGHVIGGYNPGDNMVQLICTTEKNKKYLPLLYEGYIQINWGFLNGHYEPRFMKAININNFPFFETSIMSKEVFVQAGRDVVEYLIDLIDKSYYCAIRVESSSIDEYENFNKMKYPHTIFIYGYDTEKGIFNTADFFGHSIYSFSETDTLQLKHAFLEIEDDHFSYFNSPSDIIVIKPKSNYQYSTNISGIKSQLRELMQFRDNRKFEDRGAATFYEDRGFSTFYNIIGQVLGTAKNEGYIRTKSLFAIVVHIRFFVKLLENLRDNGIELGIFIDQCNSYHDVAEIAVGLSNKYNITNSEDIKLRIHGSLAEMLRKYETTILNVIDVLENGG